MHEGGHNSPSAYRETPQNAFAKWSVESSLAGETGGALEGWPGRDAGAKGGKDLVSTGYSSCLFCIDSNLFSAKQDIDHFPRIAQFCEACFFERKGRAMVIPVVFGYDPVIREAMLGHVLGHCTVQSAKRTPKSANRSMLGEVLRR